MRLKKARGKKWRFCQKHYGKAMATLKKDLKYKFDLKKVVFIYRHDTAKTNYFSFGVNNERGVHIPNEFKPLINVTP